MNAIRYASRIIVCAGLLCACGTAQFVRDETGHFVEAGNKVTAEATAFYALTVQSDNDFYATVIATAPTCPVPDLTQPAADQFPPVTVYGIEGIAKKYQDADLGIEQQAACKGYLSRLSEHRVPPAKTPKTGKPVTAESWVDLESRYQETRAPLCMPADEIACLRALPEQAQASTFRTIQPAPLGTDAFKPELETIQALSEYLEALGKLAANPDSKIDDRLKKAVDRLENVQGYLDASIVTDDVKKKASAVGGLLKTLIDLRESAQKSGKIRTLLAERSRAIATDLETLAGISDRIYKQIYLQSVSLRTTRLKNYLEMQPVGQTISDRQLAMAAYQKDALILRGSEKLKESPTGTALRGVVAAQAKLLDAVNGRNLTAEQRAAIAAASLQNFRNVLKGLYGVLGAVGVL